MKKLSINYKVFLPSFILLLVIFIISYFDPGTFTAMLNAASTALLTHFGWSLSLVMFAGLIILIIVAVSPFGRVKIGGDDAKPILKNLELFTVATCAAIAGSILYWGFGEPIIHFYSPPAVLGIEPGSAEAAKFALSATYLHWGIFPCAINCLTIIAFAYAFYNKKMGFSLEKPLVLAFAKERRLPGAAVNIYCLVSFACALIGSLAMAILSLSGGLEFSSGGVITNTNALKTGLCVFLIITYTLSSVSGIKKGIRILSNFNFYIYVALIVFILFTSDFAFILNLGTESVGYHLDNLFGHAMLTDTLKLDTWCQDWNIYTYAACMAYTPITALFLCRIFYGKTVREIILFEFVYPVIFTIFWLTVLGGCTINMELTVGGIAEACTQGTEYVAYAVLGNLPFGKIVQYVFLFTFAISFVTAADSTTNAMACVSSLGVTAEKDEPSVIMKVLWGVIIGGLACVVAVTSGLSGIRAAANVGGIATTVFEVIVLISLVRLAFSKEH